MIALLVDESYAFDVLSTLMVKCRKSKSDDAKRSTAECVRYIVGQLGKELYDSIVSSDEFKTLMNANERAFDRSGLVKTDSCEASDVDKTNCDGCRARTALQEKFFLKSRASKMKFEYETYDKEMGNVKILDFLTPREIGRTRIRLGRNFDGGYVAFLEPIQNSKFYIGFGVGYDISFENALMMLNPGICGRIYDGTVEFLPNESGLEFRKEMVHFGNGTNYFDSHGQKFVCKMDIEGEEYNLPLVGKSAFDNCEMLVMEIHWIGDNAKRLESLLEFLKECGFVCAHTHGNNHEDKMCKIGNETVPKTIEVTFVKNQTDYGISPLQYPIPGLDFPCYPFRNDIPLDFIKRRQTLSHCFVPQT